MFFSKKSKKYVLFLLCVVTLGLRANFDYLDMYMLEPSLYTDKVTVYSYNDSFFYDLSLDHAFAVGILQDDREVIWEAVAKMRKIEGNFCVEELLGAIKNSNDSFKFFKCFFAATACVVLGTGTISVIAPNPAGNRLMRLSAILLCESMFFYWLAKNDYRKFLRQVCQRILKFERSLFAITDMDKTKKIWQEIKSTIDDKVLAGKIEEFFGLKFEY